MKCGNCGIEMRYAGNGQWWCDNPDCVNDGDNEYLPLPDEAHMMIAPMTMATVCSVVRKSKYPTMAISSAAIAVMTRAMRKARSDSANISSTKEIPSS
jgi:hypothetical protein